MTVLHISLSASVMIGAILGLRAIGLHRLPKMAFVTLWGIAVVRLLLPFAIPYRFSILSGIDKVQAMLTTDPSAATPVMMPPVNQVVTVIAASTAPAPSSLPTGTLGMLVWLLGASLFAVFFLLLYRKNLKEFKTSLLVMEDYAAQWLRRNPLRRAIEIRQSDRIGVPLTYGLLRPVILMPKTTDWENERSLNYVLTHEMIHIKRFDALLKLFLAIALSVHWFNPLVWAMYFLANRDIELSCDEAVIRALGIESRESYALTLIGFGERNDGPMPLVSSFNKNAIEERIISVMKTKKMTRSGILMAIVLIAGIAVACGTDAPQNSDTTVTPVGTSGVVEASADSEQQIHEANYGNSHEKTQAVAVTTDAITFDVVAVSFEGDYSGKFTEGRAYAFYEDAASGGQRGINVKDDMGIWHSFGYKVPQPVAPRGAEAVTTGQYVADSGDQSIHEANYGASTETVAVAELTDNAIRFDAVPALFSGEFKNLFTAGKRYAFYLDAASGGQRGINVKDDTGVWRTFTYRVTVQ